ncbi:hypothetical protein CVT25_005940 [Psilocybe cyanescens]|uniref:Uncharacterized protein n=1 Tax=Psilocybe cyanescens TaxID=93625 RepID=A0A409VSS0_PSICY|nr:hypothetical protein CVT25_005940 [Psilocybe cyanescens]
MIDTSPTLRLVTPYTVKLGETTTAWSRGAIPDVPQPWAVLGRVPVTVCATISSSVATLAPGYISTGVRCCWLGAWKLEPPVANFERCDNNVSVNGIDIAVVVDDWFGTAIGSVK